MLRHGIITTIVAGSPSRAHVILRSSATWRKPKHDAWIMAPVCIQPLVARVTLESPLAVIEQTCGSDESDWRHGDRTETRTLVIEEQESPSMTAAAISRYLGIYDNGICPVRLMNGSAAERPFQASTMIGVGLLADMFRRVETRGKDYLVNAGGIPASVDVDRIVIDFGRYTVSAGGEIIPKDALQAQLASAESLRAKPAGVDEVYSLSSAKEALAASLMLSLWSALQRSPSAPTTTNLSRGYNFNSVGSLRRGVAL